MTIELGVLIGVMAFVISAATFFIGRTTAAKKEGDTSGREMGQILTEIGYIKSQNDGLTQKIEKYNEQNNENYVKVCERLAAVEQKSTSAHMRIDILSKKIIGGSDIT